MTGGSCLFPGMAERLEAGILMIRPCDTPIRVVRASDPILDAWHGAAAYAAAMQFPRQTFTRMDYFEKGEDWLRPGISNEHITAKATPVPNWSAVAKLQP
ncbi:hypothetical protein C3L33_02817, partial [Rhododendron williamsianum]